MRTYQPNSSIAFQGIINKVASIHLINEIQPQKDEYFESGRDAIADTIRYVVSQMQNLDVEELKVATLILCDLNMIREFMGKLVKPMDIN